MNLKDKATYKFLIIFKKFLSFIGSKNRYWLSKIIANLLYYIIPLRIKIAEKNIKIAFPNWSKKRINKTIYKTYQFFIHNMIEFFSFPNSWNNIEIAVNGKSHVKKNLNNKKGIIFITGHFGSWEILGSWIGKNFPLFTGVAIKQKNLGAHKFFIQQRELAGTKHILKKEPIEKMYNILSSNGILGLVSDQDAKKNGVFINFFKKPASTSKGAALFHINTQAPIMVVVCNQINYKKYEINLIPLSINKITVEDITQDYTTILEKYIVKYPEQYFWFHRRWKTKP
tara:strand:- start:959 stop:1810 length:852 start_codon:yes stop_codon:yes gene_type:complete